jgi:hypothetical protein
MGWRDHLKIRPACNLLPAMTPEGLRALSDDIKANTLQERAKLIRDGDGYEMIDGRSRMDAVEMIGPIQVFTGNVPNNKFFEVIDLEGRDPLTFVISANIHRRHLNDEDKTRLMAELIKADPTKSDRQIAKQVGASPTTAGKVRNHLEAKGDVSTVDTRVDTKGRWQRARKAKPAEPGKRRKRHQPAPEMAPDDTEPRLPLEPGEVSTSPVPEAKRAPPKPAPEAAAPPDPVRVHVSSIIGAVAALDNLPGDFDFDRMAHIVDAGERPHLRGRVSRGMDALNALWDALGEAIEPTALAEQDPSLEIIDDSLEISEQMPPLPE